MPLVECNLFLQIGLPQRFCTREKLHQPRPTQGQVHCGCSVSAHRCLGWCLPVWLQVLCPVPAGAHSRELPAGEGTPCPVDEVSDPGPPGLCQV